MPREIPLTRGMKALVDDADYAWLNQWKWYANGKTDLYALRSVRGKATLSMHRLILGLEQGDRRLADHINHNTLDNRRCNLRIATKAQNSSNRVRSSFNTSGFTGVTFHKQTGKWQASITHEHKHFHLGLFSTPECAHIAYRQAALQYFGEFAHLEVAR